MNRNTLVKVFTVVSLLGVGVLAGTQISSADAQTPEQRTAAASCVSGFAKKSQSELGYVCVSGTPVCASAHEANNQKYESGKFSYRCQKSSTIPK